MRIIKNEIQKLETDGIQVLHGLNEEEHSALIYLIIKSPKDSKMIRASEKILRLRYQIETGNSEKTTRRWRVSGIRN